MGRTRRILVAEDSPTQAERVRLLLEDAGYRVEVVANGREGLQRIHEKPPDLIISDIMMPEMDGYTFCRAVKSNETTRRIPFVLLTERKGALDIIKGLERGADNFITKPFEDEHLLERIHRIFEHLELRKTARLEMEVTIRVGRREIVVSPDKQQIIELLFSTFEDLSRTNKQLEESQRTVEDYARNLEERVEERTKALKESEARLSGLIDAAADAIVSVDESQRIGLFNRGAEKIFGYTADEVIGQPLDLLLPPHVVEAHAEHIRRFKASSDTARRMGERSEVLGRRKDGTEFPGEASIAKTTREGQTIFTVIFRDISNRRQIEEQLRQAQKMEAIGQLTSGIAHDFNNLLTVINGYSELTLQILAPDDPQRGNVAYIKQAGDRAAALTRQLLAFSRKQVLSPKVLDLNAVVTNLDSMLRRLIGEDIQLSTVPASGLWRVKADQGLFEQVIMNLAVNARDAMPQGGRLTIETANVELDNAYARRHVSVQPGSYVMLAVSDTGCGMDAGTQARIFEPFFTTKEKGKGTGLGLSTVYGIVKQSGGNIWVYSEPGRGTTFKIYLPRVEESVVTVEPETAPLQAARGSETVLLVEDEESVRTLVRTILQTNGYTVLEASNGGHALQLCERHPGPIHLLVSDVVMPEMSGRELAERLTSSRPNVKVLYLSGYTDNAIVRHGVLEPGTAFLQKPFTPDSLLRKVREVLDA
jgi:PAS domain S-box-containing protein